MRRMLTTIQNQESVSDSPETTYQGSWLRHLAQPAHTEKTLRLESQKCTPQHPAASDFRPSIRADRQQFFYARVLSVPVSCNARYQQQILKTGSNLSRTAAGSLQKDICSSKSDNLLIDHFKSSFFKDEMGDSKGHSYCRIMQNSLQNLWLCIWCV